MEVINYPNNNAVINGLITATNILRSGGLVVYPTDTVYGLACDATNQKAVDKLKAFKGQRGNKPISIAVGDQAMAQQHATLNQVAKNLYSQFLPGPLTIISNVARRSAHPLASGITSLEGTVGVRIIPHPFVTEIFNHIDFPITATSANISNGANPRSLKQWLRQTPKNKQDLIDVFIDAGDLPYAEPSTIIDTSKEDTQIVRQGSIVIPAKVGINSQSYTSHSPEETKKIAQSILAQTLNLHTRAKPLLITLQGPLGAGKTVFTQGLATALGITEPLRSPTYTLVKEYSLPKTLNLSPITLFHIDAWRLSSPEEFQDMGLDDMLKTGNIIVIEWPQRIAALLPQLQTKATLLMVDIFVNSPIMRTLFLKKLA